MVNNEPEVPSPHKSLPEYPNEFVSFCGCGGPVRASDNPCDRPPASLRVLLAVQASEDLVQQFRRLRFGVCSRQRDGKAPPVEPVCPKR